MIMKPREMVEGSLLIRRKGQELKKVVPIEETFLRI